MSTLTRLALHIGRYVKHTAFGERVKVERAIFTKRKISKSTGDCLSRNSILKQKFWYHFIEKQNLVGQNRIYLFSTACHQRDSVNLWRNIFGYFWSTIFFIKWYEDFCFTIEFCLRQSPDDFLILHFVDITRPI